MVRTIDLLLPVYIPIKGVSVMLFVGSRLTQRWDEVLRGENKLFDFGVVKAKEELTDSVVKMTNLLGMIMLRREVR